ncbi:hypothetical protein EG329_000303 [Mollisiaceae sp. DMI_Dod_QoI]|nr:hypothetical protein EG329_000303 [Helotiales sp. DMI_Dod_QoI]
MAKKKKSTAKPVEGKPAIVHTKRRQVEDSDGWTHIVDTPKATKPAPKIPAFHGGDFEINGVSYINRSLEEMKDDFAHWKKAWEECVAYEALKQKLEGMEKVESAVVLGLGSLQSSRREGRRASATQLAALQTIIEILRGDGDLPVVLQDPQYTDLDKEFLVSLGYKVVDDPEAFTYIGTGSLVYAIHCYGPVYKQVSDGPRPAVLIGTNVENFGRFDASIEGIKESLEGMVKDCQILDFPQIRHDFSDTKIYWRKAIVSKS